jgi:hypothetical protein
MGYRLKYTYSPSGYQWVVRRWEYYSNGASGTKVSEHSTLDEAKAEANRLNAEDTTHPMTSSSSDE